jgi:hypothetical protein
MPVPPAATSRVGGAIRSSPKRERLYEHIKEALYWHGGQKDADLRSRGLWVRAGRLRVSYGIFQCRSASLRTCGMKGR